MIPRVAYLQRLEQRREQPLVKTVSGIRGSGKTTLLALYIDRLKQSGVDDGQIIFIGMEEPENESLLHYQGLYSYVTKRLCADRFTYVFIDDIQNCADYAKALEGLLIKKHVDLYVSLACSGAFAGVPHAEIQVLPLSFAEYLFFCKVRAGYPQIPGMDTALGAAPDSAAGSAAPRPSRHERRLPRHSGRLEKYLQREAFNNYLSFGGFPFAALLGGINDAGLIRRLVEGIYSTVLVKDLARQISDIPLLESVVKLASHATGSSLSAKKLSAAIGAKGRKISANTVETCLRALASAFVLYHAGRFDIKTGKHLKTLGKYYLADTGIRNLLLESSAAGAPDLDSQLENIVCLELLRRDYRVHVGKYGSDELSFVAFKNGSSAPAGGESWDPAYFQVASSVRDNAVLACKLSPLEHIQDKQPKYLLSLDETPFRSSHNGIIRMNLIDWLVNV